MVSIEDHGRAFDIDRREEEAARRIAAFIAKGAHFEHYYDIELTYTSNAIEGNTLSPVETTVVAVGGKPLKDHLEVLDHYHSIRYVRGLARQETPLVESDVRNLHRLVMQRSAPEIAGQYADLLRYVRTETGRHPLRCGRKTGLPTSSACRKNKPGKAQIVLISFSTNNWMRL